MNSKSNPDSFMKVALFSALVASAMALYLFWQNQQLSYQLAVSRQAIGSPSPSPSANPTADWQTFTHPTQNYQLMYPNDWQVAVNSNAKSGALFGPTATSEKGEGGVEVRELPLLDPKNFHDKDIVQVIEQKEVTLKSGITGYRSTYKSAVSGIDFVFKSEDGLIYNIYLNSKTFAEIDSNTFDQILSTFIFTK